MIDKVLEERGSRYGTFADHAAIAQGLQDILRAQDNWAKMKPDSKQALTVICDKIARMLNGDPEYDDNWTDIIGYATLVLNRINADKREAEKPKVTTTQLTGGSVLNGNLFDDGPNYSKAVE